MKLLHTADWHLGKRLQDVSRLEEQKEVLEEIVAIAESHEVDMVLLAGDVFDTFNPSHEAVELLYKTLRKLSKNGQRPIVVISGNHDSTQFIEAPDPLAREMGIFFYSRYDTVIPTGKSENGTEVLSSDPGFVSLKLPQYDFPIRIILAPYANELLLRTYLGEENRESELRTVLGARWRELARHHCDDSGVNLFLGHFFFVKEGETPEPEPESERPILHVGGTQALHTSQIPNQIQYAALGHLHRYHACSTLPVPAVYASSPLAYSFSEAGQQKQVVLIEVNPGKPARYEAIPLYQGRRLERKTFDKLTTALEWLEANPHCFVELTYETDHSIDAETRRSLMKAHDGIINLIPQIKNRETESDHQLQVRDLEKDMPSLFNMYYQSEKGQPPNKELVAVFKEVIAQVDPS
ncbi:metallophosphoesterase family protein [Cyclobacterium jeungdonense]|uniref:Nuclease SbcCD subunit D n=1 Tax=Cyclobacterium jeungdonense TaxID=708087 RepID=A0ABT8C7I8_9BACT|nr:exonuclease subunit SbcD [Cyclobacterium jeungdonense]MDN3688102.1 exonuclease subunit SbcD [Cyclobacterium jeungdonense]